MTLKLYFILLISIFTAVNCCSQSDTLFLKNKQILPCQVLNYSETEIEIITSIRGHESKSTQKTNLINYAIIDGKKVVFESTEIDTLNTPIDLKTELSTNTNLAAPNCNKVAFGFKYQATKITVNALAFNLLMVGIGLISYNNGNFNTGTALISVGSGVSGLAYLSALNKNHKANRILFEQNYSADDLINYKRLRVVRR